MQPQPASPPCALPPAGWYCTLPAGHDGPCPTREDKNWYTDQPPRPTIVCLCGSTRFKAAFEEANLRETLDGKIVLMPGSFTHDDAVRQAEVNRAAGNTRPVSGDKEHVFGPEIAAALDELYRRKIDLADEVLVLNVGGYLGSSTRAELEYAAEQGKRIYYLEKPRRLRDDYSDNDDLWQEHGRH